MSAARPKINRKLATVKENALAGHVEDAAGIFKSLVKVGRMTVKPETKYSCRMLAIIQGWRKKQLPRGPGTSRSRRRSRSLPIVNQRSPDAVVRAFQVVAQEILQRLGMIDRAVYFLFQGVRVSMDSQGLPEKWRRGLLRSSRRKVGCQW